MSPQNGCHSSNSEQEDPCVVKFLKLIQKLPFALRVLVVTVLALIFLILSLPILIYRFVLSNFIVRFFSDRIGRPVRPLANMFAIEFLRKKFSPRCVVVTNIAIDGDMGWKETIQLVDKQWIKRKLENSTELRYPEMTQYVDTWMGFMFWKNDLKFELQNHLIFHELPENATTDEFVCSLMEQLLNKPFPPKQSPWEVHFIRNCVFAEVKPVTVMVFRFHHVLADGVSYLHAVLEGLFGVSMFDMRPSTYVVSLTPNQITFQRITKFFRNAWKILGDLVTEIDNTLNLACHPRTQWHVDNSRKTWTQLYSRSPLICVDRIKNARDQFGGSFTGVLFSCISAGVANSLNKNKPEVNSLTVAIPLPLPRHHIKLENQITAALFDLPVHSKFTPAQRLMECERRLQTAKMSMFPTLSYCFFKIAGSHLAFFCKHIFHNVFVPVVVSNVPGPKKEILLSGRRALTTEFGVGGQLGVMGIGFTVISYNNFLRISVTAEQAVLNREEMDDLVKNIVDEIENLEKDVVESTMKDISYKKDYTEV